MANNDNIPALITSIQRMFPSAKRIKRKHRHPRITPEVQVVSGEKTVTTTRGVAESKGHQRLIRQQIVDLLGQGKSFGQIRETLNIPTQTLARHYLSAIRSHRGPACRVEAEREEADIRMARVQQEAYAVFNETRDPACLNVVVAAERRRDSLKGLDMPKQVEYSGGAKLVIEEVIVHTRDDINAFNQQEKEAETKLLEAHFNPVQGSDG